MEFPAAMDTPSASGDSVWSGRTPMQAAHDDEEGATTDTDDNDSEMERSNEQRTSKRTHIKTNTVILESSPTLAAAAVTAAPATNQPATHQATIRTLAAALLAPPVVADAEETTLVLNMFGAYAFSPTGSGGSTPLHNGRFGSAATTRSPARPLLSPSSRSHSRPGTRGSPRDTAASSPAFSAAASSSPAVPAFLPPMPMSLASHRDPASPKLRGRGVTSTASQLNVSGVLSPMAPRPPAKHPPRQPASSRSSSSGQRHPLSSSSSRQPRDDPTPLDDGTSAESEIRDTPSVADEDLLPSGVGVGVAAFSAPSSSPSNPAASVPPGPSSLSRVDPAVASRANVQDILARKFTPESMASPAATDLTSPIQIAQEREKKMGHEMTPPTTQDEMKEKVSKQQHEPPARIACPHMT